MHNFIGNRKSLYNVRHKSSYENKELKTKIIVDRKKNQTKKTV